MTIRRLWLIGCGKMAGAMLDRWTASGALAAPDLFVLNRREQALPDGVRQGRELPDEPLPDAVMLGIKPQQFDGLSQSVVGRIAGVPLLLSIMAGITEKSLAARARAGAVVRVMPNLPVKFGKGAVALQSDSADGASRIAVERLMTPLGLVEWVGASQFDAVTALSGSGPAFVYRFIDALAGAGAALGIPADQALRLALATVEGSAMNAAAASETPALLAEKVASPGGTTRAGLDILDRDEALVRLVAQTLAAAERRGAELAQAKP